MAQDTELAGHVLGGKFRLVRTVSDGPRKVYEARHDRLTGRFAVKVWPTTTPWEAFRRGAELVSTLRHPGVMQVLDFNYETGGPPFLVLEWVEGKRLSELIAESGLLPVERVAPIIESAAWALASAHQQGIVHQHLRPEEIYVVQAPGTMREWVKIAGFGVNAALARVRTPPPSRYRAPEQMTAEATAALVGASVQSPDYEGDDPQSDQYALAAIAYELLAGVPPFDEERSHAEPLPIADLAPGVSPAIDAAIRQALATEPEQRFAGVLEFARALREGVEGASPEAVRRLGEGRARGRRDGEAVSPFFNPLQGAFRRVATTTAKLRTLGDGSFWPARTSARIALAGGLLVLAFAGAAFLMRRPMRTPDAVALASAPVASAPEPAPVVPATAPTIEAEPPSAVAPQADARAQANEAAAPAEEEEAAEAKPDRAAAWARLASNPSSSGRSPKKTAPKTVAATRVVAAAPPPAPTGGSCMLTVGSRPPADVLIDEKSIGRRTPVVKYRLPCGDHKLVLRRADLDIYQMEIVTLKPGVPFRKVYPLQ